MPKPVVIPTPCPTRPLCVPPRRTPTLHSASYLQRQNGVVSHTGSAVRCTHADAVALTTTHLLTLVSIAFAIFFCSPPPPPSRKLSSLPCSNCSTLCDQPSLRWRSCSCIDCERITWRPRRVASTASAFLRRCGHIKDDV